MNLTLAERILPVPAFSDNYIWVIQSPDQRELLVVDPGDGQAVLEWQQSQAPEARITGILVTHHHPDHIGGISTLLGKNSCPVYGPAHIQAVDHPLQGGEQLAFPTFQLKFDVIAVPGHTLDHLAYFANNSEPVLFSGDTLFAGGCGRLFEGDASQMHQSLTTLSSLPEETLIYCAHEYTLGNLAFAVAVEPENTMLKERIRQAELQRQHNRPTVPSSLSLEKATNPFLRSEIPEVVKSASLHFQKTLQPGVETFAAVREWKDHF